MTDTDFNTWSSLDLTSADIDMPPAIMMGQLLNVMFSVARIIYGW